MDLRALTRPGVGLQLGIEVTVVSDPAQVVEQLAGLSEQIEAGGPRRSTWFDNYLATRGGSRPIRTTDIGRTPTYMGRVCCYQHMSDMEPRIGKLRLPHDTTCPECHRVFRLSWGLRRR
jgi:hypothetical protein